MTRRCKKMISLPFVLSLSITVFSQHAYDRIKLNQLGFYPNGPKLAVITGEVAPGNFYITSSNLRDTVYTGVLAEQKTSAYSKTVTRFADFSVFKKKGSFVVLIPGIGASYVFKISNDVNREVGIATLKGFYFQ